MEQSKSGEFGLIDLKKWGINVLKYVIVPSLITILSQLSTNTPIDWIGVKAGVIGVIIDFLHRVVRDNTTNQQ